MKNSDVKHWIALELALGRLVKAILDAVDLLLEAAAMYREKGAHAGSGTRAGA